MRLAEAPLNENQRCSAMEGDGYTGFTFKQIGWALSKQIPLMDVMMLLAEAQSNPLHVCGLLLFEKPKGRRGLVREIVEAYRAARPTPPFDCVPELSGTHTPRWLPTLADHVARAWRDLERATPKS